MKKTRQQRREQYSDEMCREVRYQIAKNIHDETRLYAILTKWMRVAKKSKYDRPLIKELAGECEKKNNLLISVYHGWNTKTKKTICGVVVSDKMQKAYHPESDKNLITCKKCKHILKSKKK